MVQVAPPQQPSTADALAMGMKYGPNAGQALARSQYLANALEALQANVQGNIRTPGALWSNLAADALLQYGKHKADQNAMQAYQGDLQSRISAATAGTPLDPSYQPPAAQAPQVAAPPPQGATPASATADAVAPQPVTIDPKMLHLAQMVYGEARGEPAAGQQAVAAVALNRAKASGKSLDDILAAPHQFSGYNAKTQGLTPDQLGPVMANISGVYNGSTPDPTNGADHFFAPALANPGWGQGPGQMIGGHKFMTLGDQGHAAPPPPPPPDPNGPPVQFAPQTGAAPGAPQGATPPPAQPYQIASNGQTPPPPSPGVGPAPAPAPAGPPPAGAGAPPMGVQPQPQGVPHQLVTPEEWQVAKSLLSDPRTMDQGLQMIQQLKMKAASPVDMKPGTYWGPDGQAHSVEQFVDQPGAPNAFTQRSSLDNSIHSTPNAAYGPVAGGMHMNNQGAVSPVPVQTRERYRIPGSPGWYVTDDKGNPAKVADDNYTVKDVGSTMQELTSSQQYDKAAKLTEMYRGAVQAASRPGGISDAELKDNAAQIFSGGVARQFNAKMLDEGQGPWLRLKQFGPELISGQKLSPQARQAMVQAMHDYATEAQTAFGGLAQSKSAYAAQNGVDLSPFIKPLMQPLPDVPDLGGIPNGGQGYPSGVASPNGGQPPTSAGGVAGVAPGLVPRAASAQSPFPQHPDARRAPDGNWYVQRGGQFYRVDPVHK